MKEQKVKLIMDEIDFSKPYIVKVDVGNMPKEQILRFIEHLKTELETRGPAMNKNIYIPYNGKEESLKFHVEELSLEQVRRYKKIFEDAERNLLDGK